MRCGPPAEHVYCCRLAELMATATCRAATAALVQGRAKGRVTPTGIWRHLKMQISHNLGAGLRLQVPQSWAKTWAAPHPSSGTTALLFRQIFHRGAVVTDAARCTALGIEVLNKQGSSVDAAIASALCAGIVNPHTSGIGG